MRLRLSVIVLMSAIFGVALPAQQPPTITNMDAAIAVLESGPESRANEALDYVLGNLNMARPDVLLMASMMALHSKRLEDAGFLFYAGQLRTRVDQKRFPAVGQGGNDPAVAIGALMQIIGAEINPAIMRDLATFRSVLDRVEAWDTDTAPGYDPGWKYAKPPSAAEAKKIAETVKAEYLRGGRGVLSLISIPEYLAALRESEDAMDGDLSDETKLKAALERHRKAQERMCEIEKKMKVDGFCRQKP